MIELDTLEKVDGTRDKDKDVVLFALSTCPHCRHAREWLDNNSVEYRFVYVDKLEGDEQKNTLKASEKFNPNNTFPTLVIDDHDVIVGFRESDYHGKLQ